MKIVIFYMIIIANITNATKNSCDIREIFLKITTCYLSDTKINILKPNIYILYDVNSVEGFNLRRDVYIRMAVFLKSLKQNKNYSNAKIVLPPFSDLNHWRSRNIDQTHIFWNHFFDLDSLKMFTSVIDFWEFFNELNNKSGKIMIDQIFKLQHFKEMFENGVFIDKFESVECDNKRFGLNNNYFGYENITGDSFTCMNFQGSAMLLEKLLDKHIKVKVNQKSYTVLFLNAETVLHEHWGNNEYWKARRSMRFNKHLVEIANKYKLLKLNSTESNENIQVTTSWLDEKPHRKAVGGNYLCAHLRRSDFLYGRDKTTPTLQSAAIQIKNKLKELNLRTVFISSDCTRNEFKNLKNNLIRYNVVNYTPESFEDNKKIKDGGVSIIDQIICSHSRYFIGTYESTFTYRIYEEREILGFKQNMTFNTFCKYEDLNNCDKNSVWPIVY